jgi:hypothetical protein
MKTKAERREQRKQNKMKKYVKNDHVGDHDELSKKMKKHLRKKYDKTNLQDF